MTLIIITLVLAALAVLLDDLERLKPDPLPMVDTGKQTSR